MRDAHASWILAGGADIQPRPRQHHHHDHHRAIPRYRPGTGEAALVAFNAVRGQRTARAAPEVVPEATAEDKAPDMAELLKMMATMKDAAKRLSVG
jgi:hypothetical protein